VHSLRMFDFGVGGARGAPLTSQERQRVDEAMRFASAVGALVCMGEGAIGSQPSAQEVKKFLGEQ
jgi:sugar/nucleoside kinase (ribokinase family)